MNHHNYDKSGNARDKMPVVSNHPLLRLHYKHSINLKFNLSTSLNRDTDKSKTFFNIINNGNYLDEKMKYS